MASSAPAAPSRCPVIDFVEDTMSVCACSPKTRLMAAVSSRSFGCVDVPWALMYSMSVGRRPAWSRAIFIARAFPSPSGDGAVMWYASAVAP